MPPRKNGRNHRTPAIQTIDRTALYEAVIKSVEVVTQALSADRQAERAHEIVLLTTDRDYALQRLCVRAADGVNGINTLRAVMQTLAQTVAARAAHDVRIEPGTEFTGGASADEGAEFTPEN